MTTHDYTNLLNSVMTAADITAEYGIADSVVRIACARGWIPSRQSGRVYLIPRVEAEKRWRHPKGKRR